MLMKLYVDTVIQLRYICMIKSNFVARQGICRVFYHSKDNHLLISDHPKRFMRAVALLKTTTTAAIASYVFIVPSTIHSFTLPNIKIQYLSSKRLQCIPFGCRSYYIPSKNKIPMQRVYTTKRDGTKKNVQPEDDAFIEDDLYLLSSLSLPDTGTNTFITTRTSATTQTKFASSYHAPVMWKECIDAMNSCARAQERVHQNVAKDEEMVEDTSITSKQSLIYVDGTLGGGGHSQALLESLLPGDIVFGADIDPDALRTASQRLSQYTISPNSKEQSHNDKPWFVPVNTNFADVTTKLLFDTLMTQLKDIELNRWQSNIIKQIQDEGLQVDGILLDLGVSSYQIDTAERGFAFMKDGPLNMRMDRQGGLNPATSGSNRLTAADICNEMDVMELRRIFQTYGDEPRARVIAESIVQRRPLTMTSDLYEAVAAVTPQFVRKGRRMGRMATLARIFQSLRIAVNQEDIVLERALTQMAPALLRQGGRLVVLSYHSMEDRATKRVIRDGTVSKREAERNSMQRDMYGNYVGDPKPFRAIGKAQKATAEEIEANTRARSATLRVAERL